MNSCRTVTSVLLAAALAGPSLVYAQRRPGPALTALTSDSAAWQRILVYTVSALSVELVASAADSSAQPWRLQLPAGDLQAKLLARQLQTILRIREPTPRDTLVRSLEVGSLRIFDDTARVDVRFTETRTCPRTATTTGFGWSTTVLVLRDPLYKFWGAARSRTTVAGDRAGC